MKLTFKAQRVNAGVKQKEAAQQLGVTVKTLHSWERGLVSPPFAAVVKMAEMYKCSVSDFLIP